MRGKLARMHSKRLKRQISGVSVFCKEPFSFSNGNFCGFESTANVAIEMQGKVFPTFTIPSPCLQAFYDSQVIQSKSPVNKASP